MIFLLFIVGIMAGFINTLAGGGSILTLPVLILTGMPSPVANATNRVAILIQSATGSYSFYRHNKLQIYPVIHITIAAIIGAIIGSLFAVQIDSELFDKVLGIVFIFILVLMFRPQNKKMANTKTLPRWAELLIFFVIGLYGGFVQVGIGFIFLASFSLISNFNLIEANAIKVFIVMCFTIFSVIIFSAAGKIIWHYGLILAAGNSIGAALGVKAAIKKGDRIVRIVLTIAIVIACMKLFGVFKLIGLE